MDAEQQAVINDRDKTIATVYRSKDGVNPPYKTWLDAKAIDPSITLDWTKSWFKLNIQPTKQVGGAKNSCRTTRLSRVSSRFVLYNGKAVQEPRL